MCDAFSFCIYSSNASKWWLLVWQVACMHDDQEAAGWLQQQGVPMPAAIIQLAARFKAVDIMKLAMSTAHVQSGILPSQAEWQTLLTLAAEKGDYLSTQLLAADLKEPPCKPVIRNRAV